MKAMMLGNLIKLIASMLTPELLQMLADKVLDFVEEYVEGSKSTVDDKIVLPLCESIRGAFNIPE